jgi:hypothetical protein
VGEPATSGPLSLVPLYGGRAAPEYLLAVDAIAGGHLAITEIEGGSVPQLAAKNGADKAVLILDGEHLEGAMQDRVLNTTALLAANRKTVLPVSCVEAGRWHYEGGENFTPSDDFSYARLRHANVESVSANIRAGMGHRSDQGAVWHEVAQKHAEMGVADSSTGAMRDAYDTRRGELQKMIVEFDRPAPGQTGVAAVVEGRPVAVDVFDKPETLERMWDRLVHAYAMDALGRRPGETDPANVERFLISASHGEVTSHEGVGIGMDVILTSDSVIGKALWWEGPVVHLSLFPRTRADRRGDEARIDAPSRRSARRRLY